MRILVTGANGQVGWELVQHGSSHGLAVIGRDRAGLDICDPEAVASEIKANAVAMVINAAAYTAVDRAETEPGLAYAVNRDGPAILAAACAKANIPLLHISTDYVFDGTKKEPYVETDPVAPLGVYGKSKEAGEREIRARLDRHIILRTSWVYGVHGSNFVKTMLRLGREREEIRVVDDQIGCPTSAADIAEALLDMADIFVRKDQIAWGTYHYCGQGATSWYNFAQAIFARARQYETLKLQNLLQIPSSEFLTPTRRPMYSALDCSLIHENFCISPKNWGQSVMKMIDHEYETPKGKIL